jgi:hypothetical protein
LWIGNFAGFDDRRVVNVEMCAISVGKVDSIVSRCQVRRSLESLAVFQSVLVNIHGGRIRTVASTLKNLLVDGLDELAIHPQSFGKRSKCVAETAIVVRRGWECPYHAGGEENERGDHREKQLACG